MVDVIHVHQIFQCFGLHWLVSRGYLSLSLSLCGDWGELTIRLAPHMPKIRTDASRMIHPNMS